MLFQHRFGGCPHTCTKVMQEVVQAMLYGLQLLPLLLTVKAPSQGLPPPHPPSSHRGQEQLPACHKGPSTCDYIIEQQPCHSAMQQFVGNIESSFQESQPHRHRPQAARQISQAPHRASSSTTADRGFVASFEGYAAGACLAFSCGWAPAGGLARLCGPRRSPPGPHVPQQ
ncbi:hypothetical protein ABBQ38_011885 [Trebouxia sp. C0009 RCD-2024]